MPFPSSLIEYGENHAMKGILDINKNGDYSIELTLQDIDELEAGMRVLGHLSYYKDRLEQDHSITLAFVPKEKINEVKQLAKEKNFSISQAMYTIVVRSKTAHAIFLRKDEDRKIVNSFKQGLGSSMCQYRYDEQLGRSLLLYYLDPIEAE